MKTKTWFFPALLKGEVHLNYEPGTVQLKSTGGDAEVESMCVSVFLKLPHDANPTRKDAQSEIDRLVKDMEAYLDDQY